MLICMLIGAIIGLLIPVKKKNKEAIRKKTAEMYANFTDDDWKALGDNY